jgi:TP53 regulating kinase-like protein
MIISQGAEAIIEKKGKKIIKNRIKKSYRLDIIDIKLRKQRTKREARLLEKSSKLIPIPKVIKVDEKTHKLTLEFIPGKKLSQYLDKLKNNQEICKTIGQQIALLHDNGIIHGDLTTSNMIYFNKKVYFIDFGLGYESTNAEDKAVDLHLIKQALEAKHFKNYNLYWQKILQGYHTSDNYKVVLHRLEKVEQRGRYKQSY